MRDDGAVVGRAMFTGAICAVVITLVFLFDPYQTVVSRAVIALFFGAVVEASAQIIV